MDLGVGLALAFGVLMKNEQTIKDRIAGCLLGGAVGDALGFTTENLSRQRIKQKFGRVTDYHVWPNHGYYTDDTQLTIMVAEALLHSQGFEAQHFKRKLARWWLVHPRLSGRSTKNAAMKCFFRLSKTGYDVPGSSGAMRAAPLGIFYRDNLDALVSNTVDCCRVTHTNSTAIAGALTNAFSVAHAITSETWDQSKYLTQLCDIVAGIDPALATRFQELPELLDAEEEVALGELLRNSSLIGSPIDDIIVTAVYALLKFPNDYERSVLFCVNAGWDTDTTAAINGNMVGALNGLSRIPQRWISELENGYKGRDYILHLANCFSDASSCPVKPENFILDYFSDAMRNTSFITSMLLRKPMV